MKWPDKYKDTVELQSVKDYRGSGERPLQTYPFPWKIGIEGVYDKFGYVVCRCDDGVAKIIVEAVNDCFGKK